MRKQKEGSDNRPGAENRNNLSNPKSLILPRKASAGSQGPLRLTLTFLMWSRNSGEERQSSGLENWRQLYWKRGSRSGSRSNSL